MSPEHISVIPKFSQIKFISVLPIRPIFEIRIGPNLIWANFGITEMCSGLIDVIGSSQYWKLIESINTQQIFSWDYVSISADLFLNIWKSGKFKSSHFTSASAKYLVLFKKIP